MTRLCLLAFSVCLCVASITCSDGSIGRSQKGTDEKSSRGEPLNGISNDVLAKLNSDQDLQKVWQEAIKRQVHLFERKELVEFAKNESKSYPALFKRLKNIAKILSSDPFFMKVVEFFITAQEPSSPPNSQTDLELFVIKELRSNPALARKLMDIVSKAMETDPDLEKVWKNALDKGLSEYSTKEEWEQFVTDATKSNQAVAAKLYKFFEKSTYSVNFVLILYAVFGDDL